MTTVKFTCTPAEALARLYNASKPQGIGIFQFFPGNMSEEEAQALLDAFDDRPRYFDYLKGRVMKVEIGHIDPELGCGVIDTRLYDRDNGPGAGSRALAED